jgi:hypothetical protein
MIFYRNETYKLIAHGGEILQPQNVLWHLPKIWILKNKKFIMISRQRWRLNLKQIEKDFF